MRSEDVSAKDMYHCIRILCFPCDVALFPDFDIWKFSFAVDPSSGILFLILGSLAGS
jgi:hypothetical protein